MTVDELRAALADVPGHLDVCVRASDDDSDTFVAGGIAHVGVEQAHDDHDTPFLAIDVNTDVEPELSCSACGLTSAGCERGEDCDFKDVPQ